MGKCTRPQCYRWASSFPFPGCRGVPLPPFVGCSTASGRLGSGRGDADITVPFFSLSLSFCRALTPRETHIETQHARVRLFLFFFLMKIAKVKRGTISGRGAGRPPLCVCLLSRSLRALTAIFSFFSPHKTARWWAAGALVGNGQKRHPRVARQSRGRETRCVVVLVVGSVERDPPERAPGGHCARTCMAPRGHGGRVRSAVPKDMPHQEKPLLPPHTSAHVLAPYFPPFLFSTLGFPSFPLPFLLSFFLARSLPIHRGPPHCR